MKLVLILAAVVAGLAIVAVQAGGPKSATIALDEPVVGSATFTVTQANYANPYKLWVANKCTDGADVHTAEYLPVQWNADASMGTAGPFDVTGTEDGPVTSCTAYVWQFPSSETPERAGHPPQDVAVTYAVGQ